MAVVGLPIPFCFFSFPYMFDELLFLFLDLPLEPFDSALDVGGYRLDMAWTLLGWVFAS